MPRYIRVNSLKHTLREDWRIIRSWKVIVLWILKLGGKRLNIGSPMPIPVPFSDFIVPSTNLPANVAQKFTDGVAQLPGFSPPLYQEIWTLRRENVTHTATLRDASGEILARLLHLRLGIVHPPQEKLTKVLVTAFNDGRFLVTTDQRPTYNPVPNLVTQRQVGASLQSLLQLHQAKLEKLRKESAPIRVLDDAAMGALIDEFETKPAEFNLRRGLYEEVSPAAIEEAAAPPPVPPIVGADATDGLVLEEIEKLRNQRGSWQNAVTLALLSLLAFLAIGGVKWNWEFVGLLTVMLIFHELGHYVAMRKFHYANLRMFFVPLLGAAVMGRHYNVKGWQRAVVSLAGPVPGIMLGLILMVCGFVSGNPLLEKAALVALLLNGINLLPFVPLDGGWVLHAVLFSRHFILETAFLALAGIALLAANWAGQGRLWFYLGLLILFGIPASYRMARIAGRLRARGVPAASPDDQTIPTATALAILEELKQGPAPVRSPKHLARLTLNVFQKLNATPPGALASAGLLAIYLGAGAASLLGTVAIFAGREFFSQKAPMQVSRLRLELDPAQTQVRGGTNAADWDPAWPTIAGTFADEAQAQLAFESAARQLTGPDRATLFGQSVFLSQVKETDHWRKWFNQQGAEILVEHPMSNEVAIVKLVCEAPNETVAATLEAECAAYFNDGAWWKAWPPWAKGGDQLDPDSRKQLARLQYTRLQLHNIETMVATNAELMRLSKAAAKPSFRSSSEAILERLARKAALERKLLTQALQSLADSKDPLLAKEPVQARLARLKLELTDLDDSPAFTDSALWKFGSLPDTGAPAHPQAWYAADGTVRRNQRKLQFAYVSFYRTDCGLPALASYLAGHGCDQFSYEFEER